jgi:pSer/pThr/pTyr-binding forkhead associated (FHA) protein
MDDMRVQTETHFLAGPQRNPSGQGACFTPLRLTLEPVGLSFEVQRPDVIIGRHTDAEIRLALPEISRRHCRLIFENHQWRVYDLNSLNGVFVNGERMHEATLYDGDRLQLGTFSIVVHEGREARSEGREKNIATDDAIPA